LGRRPRPGNDADINDDNHNDDNHDNHDHHGHHGHHATYDTHDAAPHHDNASDDNAETGGQPDRGGADLAR
jgi:hypothetical protein